MLDFLRDSPAGASLPDLAIRLDMPKSSTFRYLVTLESRRYVERDSTGAYRLGPAFLPIQEHQVGILVARAARSWSSCTTRSARRPPSACWTVPG
jgi:DNA-binding IclR family transcriptional regulator